MVVRMWILVYLVGVYDLLKRVCALVDIIDSRCAGLYLCDYDEKNKKEEEQKLYMKENIGAKDLYLDKAE
jgi:hypothetical protein